MLAWSHTAWVILLLATALVSALVCRFTIYYAKRLQLIDQPGRRRSHAIPTPRGGGMGVVVAALLGLAAALPGGNDSIAPATGPAPLTLMSLGAGIVIVAAVGWLDDHRSLGAGIRLCAHFAAVMVTALPVLVADLPGLSGNPALPWILAALALAIVAGVWSINLHNFMDGINGLLALQAIFVFCVLALLCVNAGRVGEARCMGIFAAATLGFLPFNFPQARIFMGDVGSGTLGLLIAVGIAWQAVAMPGLAYAGLIACSAFVVDASATLLSRMLNGRRWYSAHREHLYQWLVRSGMSHARVVALYMAWNLLVVTPALMLASFASADSSATGGHVPGGAMEAAVVYALALLLWVLGKQYCLRKVGRPRKQQP